MKINTVWAAYFSATDTTKTLVTQMAKELTRQTRRPLETFDFTLSHLLCAWAILVGFTVLFLFLARMVLKRVKQEAA